MTRREENIAVVGEYLKESFPGDEVLDSDDFDHDSRYYRINRAGKLAHRVRVAHEFLDDHPADVIGTRLRAWGAAAKIKAAGPKLVLIAEDGVTVVPGDEPWPPLGRGRPGI